MKKVVFGQSVKDVCMNVYGSISQLGKLLIDNSFIADEVPVVGADIIADDSLGNDVIKKYYTRKNIIPSSGTFAVIPITATNFIFEDGDNFIFEDGDNFIFEN